MNPKSVLFGWLLLTAATAIPTAALPAASPTSAWFVRVWKTDDGLPNNNVNAVVQGADGYLWLGTPVGLVRFDGARFTEFSLLKNSVASSQGIEALSVSRAGGLWIMPNRGPAMSLSPDFSTVTALTNNLPPAYAWKTAEDKEGALWIACPAGQSKSVYRVKDGRTQEFTEAEGVPARGALYFLVADRAGNIWLGKGNVACVFRDGQFHELPAFRGKVRLSAARTNGVWIVVGTQLFKCDAEGNLQDFGSFQPDNPRTSGLLALEDHTGAVWIGTDFGGLFRHSPAGFERVDSSHAYILSLAEDREGNIWAGTAGGGLDRVSARGIKLEGMDAGPSLVGIQSLCEDGNGMLWGATQNGSLVSRTDGKWVPALTNVPTLGFVLCVAADPQGAVWIGTRDRILHRLSGTNLTTWDQHSGLADHSTVALVPSAKGDLWIGIWGSTSSVQRLHEGKFSSLQFPGRMGRVLAMSEDLKGDLWVGTIDGQLLRTEGDELVDETLRTAVSGQSILCLHTTADGALWIGYEAAGLGRLEGKHFTLFGTGLGLPDTHISQIIPDSRGWLWLGCSRGIFKIAEEDLAAVMEGRSARLEPVIYGRNEGLFSMEADSGLVPGAIRTRDGRLWIPMRTALAVADPGILSESREPPPARLTRVVVDGQTIASCRGDVSSGHVPNLKLAPVPLRLPAGHRKLDFEFAALSFSEPDNTHFRFRLEGFDDDWVDAEAQRNAGYPRLAAGPYRFRVQVRNGVGPWSEIPDSPGIIVTPFFWQKWWFRLAELALFTSTVIAIARYVSFRRLRLRLRVLEQQAVLDKERTRIARDLHDDLGCRLTKIVTLSELTLRRRETPEEAVARAAQIGPAARQAVKSLDETVWALNPRNDTLPHVINYLGQFAVEFLRTAGVRCQVDLPDRPAEEHISAEVRHNLFLVVQEALNNIVRHASAGEVRLHIATGEESLSIIIQDNGCGFEHAPNDAGADGLRNMRERMEEIGGEFQLQSKPGAGTRLSAIYFWPPRK